MPKALVVDDHFFIRSAVKTMLEQEHFQIIGEADNGADAVQLARDHAPDLIILDISMPKLDGLEVIGRILGMGLNTQILVLTSQPAALFATRCMKAGASGYVSKTDDLNEVLRAIKSVMGGYTFFPNLNTASVRRSDIETTEMDLIKSLSDRELAVLQHLAWGSSNKEIGDLLLLSSKTISTYKTRLIQKLNVKSVVYLAEFAKRNQLV